MKRWVLLELELNEGEVEQAELIDGSVEEYIEKELHWLTDSFDTVSVLWIADNYESNVQMEDE